MCDMSEARAIAWLEGPRIPGHLQETRTMDALPGERYPRYLRHNVSPLRRFSQVPRHHQAQVEAKAAKEGGADTSGRATPFPPAGGWASWQHIGHLARAAKGLSSNEPSHPHS